MYHPTTRVLTVLELLQTHPQLSGKELAQRLEVDVRTIRRYITMLQDLGIPVEAERGRHGAYYLAPGFKLPPLMFNEEEALALTLGLLITRQLGLTTAIPAVEGTLAKVERVMPAQLQAQIQAIQEAIIVNLPPSPIDPPTHRHLIGLSLAINQCTTVQLGYRSWNGEETLRHFNPYGLVYHGGFWYGTGYCQLRDALRTFRVDRVTHLLPCNERFNRPSDFDSLAHVLDSLANTPGTWLVEVLLKTTLENAQQQIPPAIGHLESNENGVIFRCYVQRFDWIIRLLLGLYCEFVILAPKELKTKMLEHITHLAMAT